MKKDGLRGIGTSALAWLCVGGILTLGACLPQEGGTPPPAQTAPLAVVTTSCPVDYLVRRIGGAAVHVEALSPVGEDPPAWQPTGAVIAKAAKADLIVSNGAGYEKWMATASLPRAKVVDTSEGLSLIEIAGITHSHGGSAPHSHNGTDPHTWSDPDLYREQARAVERALAAARPGEAATFEANLVTLLEDLAGLSEAYRGALTPPGEDKLAASHPAFNYLARRYGMDIKAFGFDPGEAPSAEALAEFTAWAGDAPVILLWEAEPNEAARAAFPPSVKHAYIDPLEQPGPGGRYDYLAQANANVERFKALFMDVGGVKEEGAGAAP